MRSALRVAVAGSGAIGARVARALDDGIPGLRLTAMSARRPDRLQAALARYRTDPCVLPLEALAGEADIVVECLPPNLFAAVAEPVLARGGTLVAASVGALLAHPELMAHTERDGARIVVPSGAIVGLDGLRAAMEAGIESVRLVTRKPVAAFAPRAFVAGEEIALATLTEPVRLYCGTVRQAVAAFPVNMNVAAAVSFAGIGPERTEIEVWADPDATSNRHTLIVRSRAGRFTVDVENCPDPENPKTSSLAAFSIVACLRRMGAPFTVGS